MPARLTEFEQFASELRSKNREIRETKPNAASAGDALKPPRYRRPREVEFLRYLSRFKSLLGQLRDPVIGVVQKSLPPIANGVRRLQTIGKNYFGVVSQVPPARSEKVTALFDHPQERPKRQLELRAVPQHELQEQFINLG
jgi:hypothetical protein